MLGLLPPDLPVYLINLANLKASTNTTLRFVTFSELVQEITTCPCQFAVFEYRTVTYEVVTALVRPPQAQTTVLRCSDIQQKSKSNVSSSTYSEIHSSASRTSSKTENES